LNDSLSEFAVIIDIIEAMFEALPMAILQIINNKEGWYYNYIALASFVTSALSIFFSSMTLISILNDSTAEIFYRFIEFTGKN